MAILNTKNFAALVQSQAAAIQGRATALIDFSVGSVLRALVEANAGIALWLQGVAVSVLKTTRAITSEGDDLDTFVNDFGLTRLGEQAALGTVTFARYTPSAQAIIPIGAIVKTLDGAQSFQVVVDPANNFYNSGLGGYVLGAGIASLDVPVQAVLPGAGSNVAAGFIGLIATSIPFVDTVTNAAGLTGGGDAESDDALRARFVNYIMSLSRGTIPAIIFAVTSLRLGLQAKVIEHENFDGTPNEGFLCVTVATSDTDPTPPATVLTQAMAAVNNYRAGGVWAGTFGPNVLTANVSISLTIASGFDANVVIGAVGETIRGYVNTLPLGGSLYVSKLMQLAFNSSQGVQAVPSCAVNGAAVDLIADDRSIIRAGTVTVS
jgi:uncharacterized phage protein gp47/JayE